MNHSKQSMTVPISTDLPRLGEVLAQTDVLIENLGPSRARRLGADAATVAEKYPGILAVSSSGFGHTGPWSSYRAYAYNLHTTCGPFYLSRKGDGEPVDMDMPWADLASGVALATVVAAWAVGPATRSGAAVDFAMADLVVQRFNEFTAAASAGIEGSGPEDGSNRTVPYAPQGVYPTAADRWIALSVAGDDEWRGVVTVLQDIRAVRDPGFLTEACRRANQDALDRTLNKAFSGWECDDLVEQLQTHGVRAAPVMTPSDLVADPHLATRDFFALVEHCEWGSRRLIGIPWRVVGQGPIRLGPPPRLAALPVA
jgi:crotonobetainyl-CoA:carnitine CoA-transferase CaiB-like acyl-CoA transferase